MRDLIIAVGQRANSKTWKNTRITWEQLSQKLSETIRTSETVEEYKHFVCMYVSIYEEDISSN